MVDEPWEKNGFPKKGNLFLTIFFELNQKKIDFKKFAYFKCLFDKSYIGQKLFK